MIRLCITETEHTVEYSFSSKGFFPIIFFAAYCIGIIAAFSLYLAVILGVF